MKNFNNTAIALAKALTREYGMEVLIFGGWAFTDSKHRIVLPDLGRLDENTRKLLTGFVLHEAAGHARWTDPNFSQELAENKSPEINQLFNVIEDIRVEREAGREFAGAGKILAHMNAAFFDPASKDPLEALLLFGFKTVAGQHSLDAPDPAPAREVFGADVFERIAACASSADVGRLCEDLVCRMQASPDPRANLVLKMLRESFRHKAERLSETLRQIHRERGQSGEYLVYSTAEDSVETAKEGDIHALEELLGPLESLTAQRQRLINMFRSERAIRWQGGRERGRIDARALARLEVNDLRIFKEKIPSPHVNTALTLLLDCSASMPQNGRLQAAFVSVVLLAEAVRKMPGTALEILGHTTKGQFDLPENERALYGRTARLRTYVFKSFAEPWSYRIRKRLAGYRRLHYESNLDPDALLLAVERLIVRPEPRKVLFMITDSHVVAGQACERELKRLAGEIERDGRIELVVLDVQSGEAKKYYNNVIEITDPQDLPAQLLQGLRQYMLKSCFGARKKQ